MGMASFKIIVCELLLVVEWLLHSKSLEMFNIIYSTKDLFIYLLSQFLIYITFLSYYHF